jgi:hypothetical protein
MNQSSIYVRWGRPIIFSKCCFAEAKEVESTNEKLLVFKDCRFATQCTNPVAIQSWWTEFLFAFGVIVGTGSMVLGLVTCAVVASQRKRGDQKRA